MRKVSILCFILLSSLLASSQTVYTFIGNGNWSNPGNWINATIPPEVLKSGSEIIIDPAGNGSCILDTTLIIAEGGKFTIKDNKKFFVPGEIAKNIGNTFSDQFSYVNDTSTKLGGLITSVDPNDPPITKVDDLDTSLYPAIYRTNTNVDFIDLDVPPIGDQGGSYSCTSWASAYSVLGYWSKITENNTDYLGDDKVFSPDFNWNQINGGLNKPTRTENSLEKLKVNGCCKEIDMPEKLNTASSFPSPNAIDNAGYYKIEDYAQFTKYDEAQIKFWLKRKYPILISVWLNDYFKKPNKLTHILKNGEWVLVNKKGLLDDETHAVVITGYNDSFHAFKVMSSWGVTWCNNGFIWIDYDIMEKWIAKALLPDAPIFMVIPRRPRVTFSSNSVIIYAGSSAKISGETTVQPGTTILESGICYSFNSEPTIGSSLTTNLKTFGRSGQGSFSCDLQNLVPGTKYFFRAYTITDKGITYSDSKTFYTTPITTAAITSIGKTSAVSGGDIPDNSKYTVTARGVCWNTTGNPLLTNGNGVTDNGPGSGAFVSNLTGLLENTTYYLRSYATTSFGTLYGQEMEFKTLSDTVTTLVNHGLWKAIAGFGTNGLTTVHQTDADCNATLDQFGNTDSLHLLFNDDRTGVYYQWDHQWGDSMDINCNVNPYDYYETRHYNFTWEYLSNISSIRIYFDTDEFHIFDILRGDPADFKIQLFNNDRMDLILPGDPWGYDGSAWQALFE